MEAHDAELGPIDIVVIAYPASAPMTGEAAPLLVDLVERGIIRVLDVMFVIKNVDGTFSGFDATDLDAKGVGDFVVFEGASSGLFWSASRKRLKVSDPSVSVPSRSSPASIGMLMQLRSGSFICASGGRSAARSAMRTGRRVAIT